jgi:hypothetical protein
MPAGGLLALMMHRQNDDLVPASENSNAASSAAFVEVCLNLFPRYGGGRILSVASIQRRAKIIATTDCGASVCAARAADRAVLLTTRLPST